VHLSWLQAGFSHHTRQLNWWSVHQRRLATSCCPPFRQPPTSYKACIWGSRACIQRRLTCPKYALWDSNPGSWLAKEQKSHLHFGGRRFLLLSKWRFESEMTILSCFLNCESQYLKWTYFTAKTGLVILSQRKKLSTPMFFWNDKWYDKYHEITNQIISKTQWWPVRTLHSLLGRRILAQEPPVQNIRQLEAALHREWQQLSEQDIRRLTGGMRRRVEAVIQTHGGYTPQYHKALFCSKTCPF
jgi:hypothetical protein